MSGPAQVCIKRKRNEQAPETLIVEHRDQKRINTGDSVSAVSQLQYVRKQVEDAFTKGSVQKRQDGLQESTKDGASGGSRPASSRGERPASSKGEKRVFHMTRTQKAHGVNKGKRFATFEEKRPRRGATKNALTPEAKKSVAPPTVVEGDTLKRPGRGAALGSRAVSAQITAPADIEDRSRIQAVADSLHQFALDESAKPKKVATPRFTTRRPQAQRPPPPEPRIREEEMVDGADEDYVYETYVLAENSGSASDRNLGSELDDVGYLIITSEDQGVWETYAEDDADDKEADTDDEDENAEDYYGADYPEDELASDDEFDRGAYGYRGNKGSDDEEWDEDTGAYSDDEEWSRTLEPWKKDLLRSPFANRPGVGDEDG